MEQDQQLALWPVAQTPQTRVMSPNARADDGNGALDVYRQRQEIRLQRWGLEGALLKCDICQRGSTSLMVCSGCFMQYHPECASTAFLEGYAFCARCYDFHVQQWERAQTEEAKQRMKQRLQLQLEAFS